RVATRQESSPPSLAWWCRRPAVVTTLSGRAAGVPALEMIRAMLLCVEHRGAGQLRFSTEPKNHSKYQSQGTVSLSKARDHHPSKTGGMLASLGSLAFEHIV
ncbi:hypothetical protein HZB03_02515, partial [Candidatus Woesearchaeota archaeon]|nr:hypothetical protein [Candidatus Woesearchaeota archaeon]